MIFCIISLAASVGRDLSKPYIFSIVNCKSPLHCEMDPTQAEQQILALNMSIKELTQRNEELRQIAQAWNEVETLQGEGRLNQN